MLQHCVICGAEWDDSPEAPVHHCRAASEAFTGLSAPTLDAIHSPVPPEQVLALVTLLRAATQPQHADVVVRALGREPWWHHSSRDTQRRRLRTIRDAAVAAGFPVCSTNAGYSLGDQAEVEATARRARRFASGATLRAVHLEQLAEKMR